MTSMDADGAVMTDARMGFGETLTEAAPPDELKCE